MPNHVTTILVAPEEVLDYLRPAEPKKNWEGKDVEVDFNRVIQIPDDDDPMFTATKYDLGWGFDGYSPFDWARKNWGTKWNAYDTERLGSHALRFDTAWSHPFPVIEALSRLFPEVGIGVEFADEDLGSNLGAYYIRNGEIICTEDFEAGSEEALNFASWLKYGKSYSDYLKEWCDEDEDEDEDE